MECNKCKEMTEWYFTTYPEKKGYVLCEDCYEKSKEFIVYVNLLHDELKIAEKQVYDRVARLTDQLPK
jgi:NAD-dependent SIR2 family protein deacetylase